MADTLGEILKERRKQLGIPLPQVEEQLHIRGRLLEAIEEGNYERLPNPGYVRGYISTYARYLELDPEPLLNMYYAETGHGRFHRIELPDQAVKPSHEQHALSWRAALAVVAVIALVSLAVWGALTVIRGPETPPPIAPEPTSTVSSPATTTTSGDAATGTAGAPGGAPAAETAAPTTPQPFTVKVAVDSGNASWLQVTIDGKLAYEGTANGPYTKEYRAKKTAEIKLGRPDSVTVYRDGTEVKIVERNGIGVVSLEAQPPAE